MAFQTPGTPITVLPADTPTPFNATLAIADTAEDFVTVPALKKGRSLTLKNKGPGSVFIAFDATATVSDLEIESRDNYNEFNVEIATKISFIGDTGKTPRIFGILWSGD